jgi:hypothetical protein
MTSMIRMNIVWFLMKKSVFAFGGCSSFSALLLWYCKI